MDIEYNSDVTIRKWATFFKAFSIIIMVLSALAFLILICINANYLAGIAFIVLGCGIVCCISWHFIAALLCGFADIVENTRKIANGTPKVESTDEALPNA